MSHVTTIDVQVKDLDALEAACKELGLELVRGKTTYKWFGQFMGDSALPPGMTKDQLGKCQHAVRVPGNDRAYEVGVVQQPDGTFRLAWDAWSGGYGLMERVGDNCGRLVQSYAAQVATKQARKQGYSVQRKVLADGKIQLQLTR